MITNRNADHLRAHADIEHENCTDEDIVSAQIDTIITGPETTVRQLGEVCRSLSDREREVYFRVEHVNGRTLVYPVREVRADQDVPAYLRRAG